MIVSIAVLLERKYFMALRIFSAHFSFRSERDELLQELEQLRIDIQAKDAEIKRLQSCVDSSSAYLKYLTKQNAAYKRMFHVMRYESEGDSHTDRSPQIAEF